MNPQSFQSRLKQSTHDFCTIVWPAIREWCGGGEIIPVETILDAELAKALDIYAGIDAWQICPGLGVRGIASRVQYGHCFETFTLRSKHTSGKATEIHKRYTAWINSDEGWLSPYFTVQAYLTAPGGELLDVGVIKTASLIEYIVNGYPAKTRTNSYDGNEFVFVAWKDIAQSPYSEDLFVLSLSDPPYP
jgi:hypothetical protein